MIMAGDHQRTVSKCGSMAFAASDIRCLILQEGTPYHVALVRFTSVGCGFTHYSAVHPSVTPERVIGFHPSMAQR